MYFDVKATGRRICELRSDKGITQEQLSNLLNISDRHMRYMEEGQRAPSVDLLVDMAVYFDVSLDYLILGKTSSTENAKHEINEAIYILSKCMKGL